MYFVIPSPQNEFSRNVYNGREREGKRKEMKGNERQKEDVGQGSWGFSVRGGKNPGGVRKGKERQKEGGGTRSGELSVGEEKSSRG